MTELWRLSATQLAGLIRSREVSAREATQAALDWLDQVNPRINAVVDHRPDDVMAHSGLPSFSNCTEHFVEHWLCRQHLGELFDQGS